MTASAESTGKVRGITISFGRFTGVSLPDNPV